MKRMQLRLLAQLVPDPKIAKNIMLDELGKLGSYLGQTARLMVGLPDYDNYLNHMENTHPDQAVMTYEEFFRERQDARYGGNGRIARCC
ncbi:MAG: hypothetical protein RI960_126 [Pseudomonadota bacterium]|jgi:uncharacterized short protein YbdD (DUF466 family)